MLEIFLNSKKWLFALLLVNIAGFFFGLYYYWYQLSANPFWLWIFIIDCPLYVFLFAFICGLKLKKKKIPQWLYFLTSIGLIKYGLWTGLVVWLYFDYFFSFDPFLYSIIFPLHIGMILEGIAILPHFKARLNHFLSILCWFLLNDWLDYFAGILPLIPPYWITFLMYESFMVSLILPILIYFIRK